MKTCHLLFLTGLIWCSGCSVIQKNTFWKAKGKSGDWTFVGGKIWMPYYTSKPYGAIIRSVPYYVRCDSGSLVSLAFQVTDKCIFYGPPLLPFIPGKNVMFMDDDRSFTFELAISTTYNISDSALAKNIHFFVNGSQQEALFTFGSTDRGWSDPRLWKKRQRKHACSDATRFAHNIRVVGSLNLKAAMVKLVDVRFDESLNRRLHANLRPLQLRKKSRAHYYAFVLPTH